MPSSTTATCSSPRLATSLATARSTPRLYRSLSSSTGVYFRFTLVRGELAAHYSYVYSRYLFISSVDTGTSNSTVYRTPRPISQFVARFTYIDVVNGNNGLNAGNGATFTQHNDSDG